MYITKKTSVMIRIAIIITILGLSLMPGYGQEAGAPLRDAEEKLNSYRSFLSPQKIYLHQNKNRYSAGDIIWFKLYLLDGSKHMPDTTSTNVYVDLISSNGTLMGKRVLLAENGVAEGDFNLARNLPDGNYRMRAYTNWMRNFGEEYYYSSYFYIENPGYADIIPRAEARANRRFNRNLDDMEEAFNIVFFPEGGRMVEGVPGRVAFRAFDGLGNAVDASGEVIDPSSGVVAGFETGSTGTGSFELTPAAGTRYTARVSFRGGRSRDFELPEALPEGVALSVDQDNDNLHVNVTSTYRNGHPHFSEEVVVIGHSRGTALSGGLAQYQNGKASMTIPVNDFPTGITQITVFTPGMTPLAERLVFVNHDDALVFYPEVSRQEVGDRDYYILGVDVTDKDGNPVEGSFSLSVVQTRDKMQEMERNILSEILINSDLPGITGPTHKYLDPEMELEEALDNLMMTNGWRRFTWEDVLAGEIPEIEYLPSSTLAVSGTAIDLSRDRGLPNFPVMMEIVGKDNGDFETKTNNHGRFVFDNLVFHDDVRVRLSTDRLVSNRPPRLELETGRLTGLDYVANVYTLPQDITSRGSDWERTAGAGSSPYSDMPDDAAAPQQYGVPDQTVYIERDSKQPNMYDILVTRVRGLNHNLQFRGPTSVTLSNQPLFMLDGTEIGQSAFLNLDPRYVQRLEIFSGPRASVFGVRGAAGAILAYTRRAGDMEDVVTVEEYLIQGYHSPREFYSDLVSYTRSEDELRVMERAVHWEPNLITDENGRVTTAVPVSGKSGILTFIIEGTGLEKGIGYGHFTIEEKP